MLVKNSLLSKKVLEKINWIQDLLGKDILLDLNE
jgi:hypothetical protein